MRSIVQKTSITLLALISTLLFSCSSILVPNPHRLLPESDTVTDGSVPDQSQTDQSVSEPTRVSSSRPPEPVVPPSDPDASSAEPPPSSEEITVPEAEEVDFALAFAQTTESDSVAFDDTEVGSSHPSRISGGDKSIIVPSTTIRVALRRNVATAIVYSMGEAQCLAAGKPIRFRGRVKVEASPAGTANLQLASGSRHSVRLPCTLAAHGGILELEQERYRGSIIITAGSRPLLLNLCDVEEYLRSVVPKEIGRLKREEAEALKAQAIAARTYAYRRIIDRQRADYDVLPTVADQVYGGADAETDETDAAIVTTRGRVLCYGDSICQIYYHSTCGGKTANVADVWDRPDRPYLHSVSDRAPDGSAYCSFSPTFSWEETWGGNDLSAILRHTAGEGGFSGSLRNIHVNGRFECGRVRECVLSGSSGECVCRGDRTRFILRRQKPKGPILRSANFSVVQNGSARFAVRGAGNGHGVGMCQNGAIGRARAGQSHEEILKAYFSGTEVRTVKR